MSLYKVEDMSCAHCVAAIEKSVKALDTDAKVICDLGAKTVEVTSQADPAAIVGALDQAGYEAVAM